MSFEVLSVLLGLAALVIHITVHEFGHAIAAVRAGDDTPRLQGRISLNPIDHLDPLGTVMMVVTSISGVGFGWGRPVNVNPMNFKSPRWDNLRVSFQGPLHNLVLALIIGIILRFINPVTLSLPVTMFLKSMVLVGIFLAIFNLIPLGPLDGSHIMSSLLPVDIARKYDQFNGRYGAIAILGLIFLGRVGTNGGRGILSYIISVPAFFLYGIFTGKPF